MLSARSDSNFSSSPRKNFGDSFNHDGSLGDSDFDNQVQSIQKRYAKAKVSETTRASVNFASPSSHEPSAALLEAFRNSRSSGSRYTIFWFNKREGEKLYRVVVDLPRHQTVLECIRDIIPYFNQRLMEERSNYELSTDPNLYELNKAKKTGEPKFEYPALDADQILSQSGLQNICIVETSLRAVIQKSAGMPVSSPQKPKETRISMVSHTMPESKVKTAYQSTQDEYIEETCCGCFTTRRKATRGLEDGLNNRLLGDY